MGFESRSAAKARVVFNPGVTREEAWQCLTKTFRVGESGFTSSSLVPGSYGLWLKSRGLHADDVGIGDVFWYKDHAYVVITAWNLYESFAYQEIWRPTGEQFYYPSEADSRKVTMELKIVDHLGGLVLDIMRIHDMSQGWVLMLRDMIFNPKGAAFSALDSVIGPSSEHSIAWAGGWKALPISSAVVIPAKFGDPSIL